jgi:hypothetical protein
MEKIVCIRTSGYISISIDKDVICCKGVNISIKRSVYNQKKRKKEDLILSNTKQREYQLHIRGDNPSHDCTLSKREGVLFYSIQDSMCISQISVHGHSNLFIDNWTDAINKAELFIRTERESNFTIKNTMINKALVMMDKKSHFCGINTSVKDLSIFGEDQSSLLGVNAIESLKIYITNFSKISVRVPDRQQSPEMELKDQSELTLIYGISSESKLFTKDILMTEKKRREDEEKKEEEKKKREERFRMIRENHLQNSRRAISNIALSSPLLPLEEQEEEDNGIDLENTDGSSDESDPDYGYAGSFIEYDVQNPVILNNQIVSINSTETRVQAKNKRGRNATIDSPWKGKDVQTDDESIQCKVCLSNKVKTCIVPCGHLVLCLECAGILKNSSDDQTHPCPLCRSPIHQIVETFS